MLTLLYLLYLLYLLTLLTYFTYLLTLLTRLKTVFFFASKTAKETRSAHEQRANERTSQSPVASRQSPAGGRRSAVGSRRARNLEIPLCLLYFTYLLYLLIYPVKKLI